MSPRITPSASERVRALLQARLEDSEEGVPWAALGVYGFVSAVLCGLVHDALPPLAYALFALTLSAGLVALPLLGDLGSLLRRDSASEWIEALPARPGEIAAARGLHLLVALFCLTLGSMGPAAVLAPLAVGGKLALFATGLGLAIFVAAALACAQVALGGRAESLLLWVQTLLVIGVVIGSLLLLASVPTLSNWVSITGIPSVLWLFPPTWFAAAFDPDTPLIWLPPMISIAGLAGLVLLPTPAAAPAKATSTLLGRLLFPVRALAIRFWVRADERASFDLAFDALPREREVVLRSYPMIGLPVAFLLLGSSGASGPRGVALLALLLFTVGLYLPVLLVQVPASASHEARWILESAPVSPHSIHQGAFKALAVRFLVPLYVLLSLATWKLAGFDFVLRLTLPASLVALLVLRAMYTRCVNGLPLSSPPDEVAMGGRWGDSLMGLAFALAIVAAAAMKYLTTPAYGLIASAALLILFAALSRASSAEAS